MVNATGIVELMPQCATQSDADECLVTELLEGTGGIRHLWNCESYLREVLIHPSVSTTFGWTLHSSSI